MYMRRLLFIGLVVWLVWTYMPGFVEAAFSLCGFVLLLLGLAWLTNPRGFFGRAIYKGASRANWAWHRDRRYPPRW